MGQHPLGIYLNEGMGRRIQTVVTIRGENTNAQNTNKTLKE